MARSYRTQKRSRLAERRIGRTVEGEVCYPRVIARRPRPGDSHPLSRTFGQAAVSRVPLEYLYGLDRIELRPREGESVGSPFGVYWKDEKAIILYSLPMEWSWRGIQTRSRLVRRMCQFGAKTTERDGVLDIRWPFHDARAVWFYLEVFAHELGHHHRNKYRSRNRRAGRVDEEIIADLHTERFLRNLMKQLRSRRKREGAV